MPIYEFVCQKCGFKFEKLFLTYSLFEKSGSIECPNCGNPKVEKSLSIFSTSSSNTQGSFCSSGNCDFESKSSNCCCGNGSCSLD